MSRFDTAQVRHYYDQHTARFVALGQKGSRGSIHRAIWGPGVATPEQAFRYVEDQLEQLIRQLPPSFGASHVVDLGCGVGASLCYLGERLPIRGTGITLSDVQARIASERIRDAGLSDRIRCIVGDYCAIPAEVGTADAAFAIESFVHGPSPERFFAQCRALVRSGGLLLICDDVKRPSPDAAADRTIEQFKNGWRVNSLLSADELRALALDAGFAHERTADLTPYLEMQRVRDRMVNGLLSIAGWMPLEDTRLGYLVGGRALQKALARGWIAYEMAIFRRL